MKKQLITSSALALAVAAPASAAEWNVGVGGFFNSHLAIVDTGGTIGNNPANDFDGVRQFHTGEIIFSPSVTLDNGLTFGANVQLEAQNNVGGAANNIDESYITISGDNFGTLTFGAENSEGYRMMVAAPSVTSMFINSPSISSFVPVSSAVPFNFRQAGNSAYTEVGGNNDINRISYRTPSFNGFRVGISYAANNNGNAAQGFAGGTVNNNAGATLEDIFDIGLGYSGDFGSGSVSVGARWGTGSGVVAGSGDAETWGIGASVSFGGVTVGGHYAENDNNNGTFGVDQSGWSFGATFDTGSGWTLEALTMQGEYENTGGAGVDSDLAMYKIGGRRSLGAGVNWDVYAVFVDADNNAGGDLDATILGTAINLSF